MEPTTVVYKPYRSTLAVSWVPVITLICGSPLLLAGINSADYGCIILFMFLISFCIWECIYLIRRASIAIHFDETAAKVFCGKKCVHNYTWTDFYFLYNERHYKGKQLLILSPVDLPPKTRKKMVHHRSIASKRHKDSVLVVPLFDPAHNNSVQDYVMARTRHCISS